MVTSLDYRKVKGRLVDPHTSALIKLTAPLSGRHERTPGACAGPRGAAAGGKNFFHQVFNVYSM